jgi:hypothetical protein
MTDYDLAGYEYREVLLENLRSGEHMRELVHAARVESPNIRIRLVLPAGTGRYNVPDHKMVEYADSVVTREADRDYVIKDRDADRLNIVIGLDAGSNDMSALYAQYAEHIAKAVRLPDNLLMGVSTPPTNSYVQALFERQSMIDEFNNQTKARLWEINLGLYPKTSNRWSYYHRARKYARRALRAKRREEKAFESYREFQRAFLLMQGNHSTYQRRAERYAHRYYFGVGPYVWNVNGTVTGHTASFQGVDLEMKRAWCPPVDPTSRALRKGYGKTEIIDHLIDENYVLKRLQDKTIPIKP